MLVLLRKDGIFNGLTVLLFTFSGLEQVLFTVYVKMVWVIKLFRKL